MEIKFYLSERGDNPVLKYIYKLNEKHAKKIMKNMENLEEFGLQQMLKTRDVKKIRGYKNIFELRAIFDKFKYRALFFVDKNYFILHIFLKKTKKTPQKEIKLAIERQNILRKRNNLK